MLEVIEPPKEAQLEFRIVDRVTTDLTGLTSGSMEVAQSMARIRARSMVTGATKFVDAAAKPHIFGTTRERWGEAGLRLGALEQQVCTDDDESASADPRAMRLAKDLFRRLRTDTYPKNHVIWADPNGRLVNIAIDADGGVIFEFGLPGTAKGTTLECTIDGELVRHDYDEDANVRSMTLTKPF